MHDPDGKEKQKTLNSVILIPQKDKKKMWEILQLLQSTIEPMREAIE